MRDCKIYMHLFGFSSQIFRIISLVLFFLGLDPFLKEVSTSFVGLFVVRPCIFFSLFQ